jgi:hypothetical protein
MAYPDPFQNEDPLWQPFDLLASRSADLAMPDETVSGLRSFLRSEEVMKALERSRPPVTVAPHRHARMGHIPGFPNQEIT